MREGERWTAQTIPDSTGFAPDAVRVARLSVMLDSAWVRGYYLNDAAGARAIIHRALAEMPIESIPPPDRPWSTLLTIAAVTHDAEAARSYDESFERDLPSSQSARCRRASASPAVARWRWPRGDRTMRPAEFATADEKGDVGPQQIGPWRAMALDLAGQPDSAIAGFEHYLTLPDPAMSTRRDYLAFTHKRLGELYEAKGNTAKALAHYQAFADGWKNADPELQPMVTSIRAKIALLRRKGG